MTHSELVSIGAHWLKNKAPNTLYRCNYIVTEFKCQGTYGEEPDIFGLNPGRSVKIECKTSKRDYWRDYQKRYINVTNGLGNLKFYLVPEGLITVEELPESWGLLYINDQNEVYIHHFPEFISSDLKPELYVYYSIIRRTYKPQIFDF